ncbi:uncharacterized protein [Phaseolus vulgaris]|uniref:uncharacterized protein isoform X4 n=1 Tax=Phaseolus vulgaris TaxID=3885 RepID=UPI0035C95FCF
MLNQALLPSKRGSKMSCELLTTTSERRFRPISSCHHPSKEPELSGWKNRSRGQAHRNSLLRRITTRVKPESVIKPCKPMNLVRSYASVVRLNGGIYVFGGGNGYIC